MLKDLLNILQGSQLAFLGNWKYVILALLVALEGPMATLLGAAAAASGFMHLNLVFVSASTGNLGADTLWYTLGYVGKEEWLLRLGGRVGLHRHHYERLRKSMEHHATKILLVAKLTSGFIIPSLIAAGLARIPWKRWFPPIAAGEFVWTGSLVLVGYYATQALTSVLHDMRFVALGSTIIFLLVIVWLVRRGLQKKGIDEDSFDADM